MQKITTANYYDVVKDIDWSKLPGELQAAHRELVAELHSPGTSDFKMYHDDSDIRETVDLFFSSLQAYLEKKEKATEKKTAAAPKQGGNQSPKKAQPPEPVIKSPKPASQKKVPASPSKSVAHNRKIGPGKGDGEIRFSERLPDEIRFIKRYINLDNKVKTKDELLRFINALQKAILEKRIRKTSPYATDIEKIQKDLVNTYNNMKGRVTFAISGAAVKKYREATAGEKVYLSVQYLHRYRNLIGKRGVRDKVSKLIALMKRAVAKGKITKGDPYAEYANNAFKNLIEFQKDKKRRVLEAGQQELNGLDGILGNAFPEQFNGIDGYEEPDSNMPQVMNSLDFLQMRFETLGFRGKWRDFIGDPTGNFTAMVFGRPKYGKSFLCIDFAGYLARNHGRVLYVAKEESLDLTLQEKLRDKDVAHHNLMVAAELPGDLDGYDFIFLDSVNKMGYSPDELNRLRSSNPGKSFVFIFQTTKDGNFRGSNTFQHDVDIVIEVPEPGVATQMGRFNQGGRMQIFD